MSYIFEATFIINWYIPSSKLPMFVQIPLLPLVTSLVGVPKKERPLLGVERGISAAASPTKRIEQSLFLTLLSSAVGEAVASSKMSFGQNRA
ncbi:MAG TPA: hypothetical protein VIJ95_16195 [Hanamia sp.]